MYDAIHVVPIRAETEDQANYAAGMALDDVIGWYVENGYSTEDIRERVDDAVSAMREEMAGS